METPAVTCWPSPLRPGVISENRTNLSLLLLALLRGPREEGSPLFRVAQTGTQDLAT